jgi:hypothetical protein
MRDHLPTPLAIFLAGALAAGLVSSCSPAPARPRLLGAELLDQVDELEVRLLHGRELVARDQALAFLNDPALALGLPPARGAAGPTGSAPSPAGRSESTNRDQGAGLKSLAALPNHNLLPGAAADLGRAGRSPRGGR